VRILLLCSDTGVRIGDCKGAALHLLAITSAFAALGHQTEVVGVAANPTGPMEPWDVPQHLVPHPGRAQGPIRELRKRAVVEQVAARGLDAAARLRPHLVYERLSLFGTAGLRVATMTGARHVVEINALLTREEASWRGLHDAKLAQACEGMVLAGADLRVAVSQEIAAEVRPLSGGGPLIVVPNGVDVDLFRDRPFLLVPTARSDDAAMALAGEIAREVGAAPTVVSAEVHDRAVAMLSGVPLVIARALAAAGADVADLAGPGFRDMTRLAATPQPLADAMLAGNAAEIRAALAAFRLALDAADRDLG